MLANLKRWLGKPQKRHYEGAAGGRRWDRSPTHGSHRAETSTSFTALRQRARHLVANNGFAAQAAAAWQTSLIGAGILPTSAHPDPATRKMLNDAFKRWAESADIEGRTDLFGLQAQAARAMVVDGESLLRFVETPEGMRLQTLPVELLETSTMTAHDMERVVNGVEFDSFGRRVSYSIRKGEMAADYARLPASDVAHVFAPVGAGQVRGVSWFAPVLLTAAELDQLADALLVAAKTAAFHAGILVDPQAASSLPYDGQDDGAGTLTASMEPGSLKRVPPGFDVRFPAAIQANQSNEFLSFNLHAIAAGLNLPSWVVTGDLRNANYSSQRGSMITFKRRVEQIQWQTLVPQLCAPVWRRWIASEILSGRIDAPGFERNTAEWFAVDHHMPPIPAIDPQKDVAAEIEEINAGLKSRRQAAAERGLSVEELDAQIADDRAREETLGLKFGPSQSVSNGVPENDPSNPPG